MAGSAEVTSLFHTTPHGALSLSSERLPSRCMGSASIARASPLGSPSPGRPCPRPTGTFCVTDLDECSSRQHNCQFFVNTIGAFTSPLPRLPPSATRPALLSCLSPPGSLFNLHQIRSKGTV